MDEITAKNNKRDLRVYRILVAMVIVISMIIAFGVSLITIDYDGTANISSAVLYAFMDKEITDEDPDSDTYGMTFYCERNKDFDAENDQPVNACKYYYLAGKEKVYLEDGVYYPAEYYMEDSDATSVPVYIAFIYSATDGIKILKNVCTVVAVIILLAFFSFFIYLWYLNWCRRQDLAKQEEQDYLHMKRSIETYLTEEKPSKKKLKKRR